MKIRNLFLLVSCLVLGVVVSVRWYLQSSPGVHARTRTRTAPAIVERATAPVSPIRRARLEVQSAEPVMRARAETVEAERPIPRSASSSCGSDEPVPPSGASSAIAAPPSPLEEGRCSSPSGL